MHYQELERFKAEYPSLGKQIKNLDEYLSSQEPVRIGLERRPSTKFQKVLDKIFGRHLGRKVFSVGEKNIVPSLLAKRLGVDKGLAVTLLYFAEQAGILTHKYFVFCKESDFPMGSFDDISEISDRLFCDFHGTEHDEEGFYVQLVFNFVNAAERAAI